MKKNEPYVAPCMRVRKPMNPAVTSIMIIGGIIVTMGGAGTVETASMAKGIIVSLVGLVVFFIGVHRALK